MNKLQNDYTTLEQSKRLLELGLSRLSANFYYDDENEVQIVRDPEFELQSRGYFPCWSVGRLIEIYLICNEVIDNVTELHHSAIKIDVREFNIVEYIIRKLTNKIKKNKDFLSKLEE